jgi:hypothetical protein
MLLGRRLGVLAGSRRTVGGLWRLRVVRLSGNGGCDDEQHDEQQTGERPHTRAGSGAG